MAIETIEIKDLDRNGLQTRVALDENTVDDYAEAMRNRAKFPPVKVFCDGEKFYLADGFHRVAACLKAGVKRVKADVDAGSYVDALKYALHANADHGLRRTNADKRHCLEMAWEKRRELFGANDPTADWLADVCGVSRNTANNYYQQICTNCADLTPVRQNAEGRVYTVPTAKKPKPPTKRPNYDEQAAQSATIATAAARTGAAQKAPAGAVARPPQASQAPQKPKPPTERPVREGYYIAADGKEHAIGIRLDRYFHEIPPNLTHAFFGASETLATWANRLNALKNEILMEQKQGFPIAIAQRALLEMENAYHELKAAQPHCVCRICQGRGCMACSSIGYQTKDQYERNPREYKAQEAEAEA